jgi:hypothetical protein
MLDKLCRDPFHLERLLESKLKEENKLRILDWLELESFKDIEEWRENIHSLMKTHKELGFQCETFALAVHILDYFLGIVKVHGKYLKCATLASYYIALKLVEEEEFVPSLSNFVVMTGNKFTCNDITRMEKIILEKSNWKLNHLTICSFLELFFSLICARHFKTLFGSDSLAYNIYKNLANQAQQCLMSVNLLQFKASVQSLALLSCTLERITSRWFLYIEIIARRVKIDIQEVLECCRLTKILLYGQTTKQKTQRVKKFGRRHHIHLHMRSPLSPIVENPFESEVVRYQNHQNLHNTFGSKLESVMECVNATEESSTNQSEIFNEELKRLRKISLDAMQNPSPAKRPRLSAASASSCSIESHKSENDVRMMVSSPIKPLPV